MSAVKQHGVSVILYHGPVRGFTKKGTVHKELWEACDERIEIKQKLIDEVKRK